MKLAHSTFRHRSIYTCSVLINAYIVTLTTSLCSLSPGGIGCLGYAVLNSNAEQTCPSHSSGKLWGGLFSQCGRTCVHHKSFLLKQLFHKCLSICLSVCLSACLSVCLLVWQADKPAPRQTSLPQGSHGYEVLTTSFSLHWHMTV